jgi:hypothetical protein
MEEETLWNKGPIELYIHGLEHLNKKTDFDYRIAMILIDNAVEIALKTYLIINRRDLQINRKELKDGLRSFPSLLDLFEKYSPQLISNSDLDQIERFHSMRNSLYHEGNGITVEEFSIKIYSAITKVIIEKLFSASLTETKSSIEIEDEKLEKFLDEEIRKIGMDEEEYERDRLISEFVLMWGDFENYLINVSDRKERRSSPSSIMREIINENKIDITIKAKFEMARNYRNGFYHGKIKPELIDLKENLKLLEEIIEKIKNIKQ